MNEYCITFFKADDSEEGGTEVFHCHVNAPDECTAFETALHNTMTNNHSIAGSTGVRIVLHIDLPEEMVSTTEQIRKAMHGTKATPVREHQDGKNHLH